jgi:16S rRNA (adenine1518-N6/adenine1519-N6)-dimethyltransferase
MCAAANVQAGDTVLEIGPGLGTLTQLLVNKVDKVIAVEFDEQLAARLPQRINSKNLEVVTSDILTFDLSTLPNYKVVANIPYYLTSNLVRVLSESTNAPAIAALLVQKEVAERLAAAPGNLSILGVTAQFYWDVSLGREVAAKLFTPPPKVDSQIVVLQKRSKPLFDDVEPKDFFRVVKAGFGQKRKTLLNSLSAGLHLDRAAIKVACESVGIDHIRRPQTLSLEEWHNLYNSLNA